MRVSFILFLFIPLLAQSSTPVNQSKGSSHSSILINESRKITGDKEIALSHLARGDAHLQRSELVQAIEAYSNALLLDQSLDVALLNRAMALGYNMQYEASINDLTTYIKRNPKSSLAYTKRGLFHLNNNEIFRAVKDLERAIELDRNNAEAYDDLGVIYVQSGNVNKAINYFTAATRIDPNYAKAWHNLALASLLKSDLQKAADYINRSLSLQPGNANSLMLKSVIHEQSGDLEGAQHYKSLAEEQ